MLGSIISKFDAEARSHMERQSLNPFSGSYDKRSPSPRPSKDEYGRPLAGSKTEERGQRAKCHVLREILDLCNCIHDLGTYNKAHKHTDDDSDNEETNEDEIIITFGEIFQMYTKINDKVVGLLIAAKKRAFLYFEKEILFQRRDDDVLIALVKPISEIRAIINRELEAATSPVPFRSREPSPAVTPDCRRSSTNSPQPRSEKSASPVSRKASSTESHTRDGRLSVKDGHVSKSTDVNVSDSEIADSKEHNSTSHSKTVISDKKDDIPGEVHQTDVIKPPDSAVEASTNVPLNVPHIEINQSYLDNDPENKNICIEGSKEDLDTQNVGKQGDSGEQDTSKDMASPETAECSKIENKETNESILSADVTNESEANQTAQQIEIKSDDENLSQTIGDQTVQEKQGDEAIEKKESDLSSVDNPRIPDKEQDDQLSSKEQDLVNESDILEQQGNHSISVDDQVLRGVEDHGDSLIKNTVDNSEELNSQEKGDVNLEPSIQENHEINNEQCNAEVVSIISEPTLQLQDETEKLVSDSVQAPLDEKTTSCLKEEVDYINESQSLASKPIEEEMNVFSPPISVELLRLSPDPCDKEVEQIFHSGAVEDEHSTPILVPACPKSTEIGDVSE